MRVLLLIAIPFVIAYVRVMGSDADRILGFRNPWKHKR